MRECLAVLAAEGDILGRGVVESSGALGSDSGPIAGSVSDGEGGALVGDHGRADSNQGKPMAEGGLGADSGGGALGGHLRVSADDFVSGRGALAGRAVIGSGDFRVAGAAIGGTSGSIAEGGASDAHLRASYGDFVSGDGIREGRVVVGSGDFAAKGGALGEAALTGFSEVASGWNLASADGGGSFSGLWGALKGKVHLVEGTDLTAPLDEVWDAETGRL